ncbi:hypothetical protein G3I19_20835 [Streptomyces sp. SID10853]|nr:hypothetical protein [Streptomyces sp. SID10853]NDZ80934.1 hypothetical protein [Streptomyces sp. SID10853]
MRRPSTGDGPAVVLGFLVAQAGDGAFLRLASPPELAGALSLPNSY